MSLSVVCSWLIGVGLLVAPCTARAQDSASASPATLFVDVHSATENYLRYLQSLGIVPLAQWDVRPFGPREIDRLFDKQLSDSSVRAFEHPTRRFGGLVAQVAPAVLELSYNTTFPFGINDGPEWRGRGLTVAVQGGVAVRYGILTAELRPTAFWAQNAGFPLMPNGFSGQMAFADAMNPVLIDRPQRFGDRPYARLSGGESTIRLDAGPLALGVSTANMWWGPMTEFPYLLGNNAEGFPHLFIGTSHPLNIGIGHVHGQIIYGDLEQSDYTTITGTAQRRFGSGLIVSFTPWKLDGFEIGAARFFHQPWPDSGLTLGNFKKPFEDFLKRNVTGDPGSVDRSSLDNQLASIFARWVFPASGLEVYGEFGREDHSYDERDFILSPDHEATLGLGLRKAWRDLGGNVNGARFEYIDLDPSNLARNRGEGSKYTHGGTRQGHTELGQLLGSGFSSDNGAAQVVSWERIAPSGRRDFVSLTRMVVRESTPFMAPGLDVQFALAGERTRIVDGHRVTYGLTGVYEMNRYFGPDARNLQGNLRLEW